ncbi:hypothetical protein C7271_21675 [filamentous cyanobacterium CCP5]|nr:hypothetical protein C7271_21675 [filamentous cyanobacterium CCP5]
MNSYAIWFKRVVWVGILANVSFAVFAITRPEQLVATLNLGSLESAVWLFNYAVLLTLLSCFYMPAAHDPRRYIVNAWLLVAARIIPAITFVWGVAVAFMPPGFLTLGIGDFAVGAIEAILLSLALKTGLQKAKGY